MPETGPLTRSMDKTDFKSCLLMMAEMKAGQEGGTENGRLDRGRMRVAQAGLEHRKWKLDKQLEQENGSWTSRIGAENGSWRIETRDADRTRGNKKVRSKHTEVRLKK
ncbi:hypothetical protein AVEN_184211-1 [Araneus ventricosus]|uniref:Uncharacterized protein n=1 Tax=Araneus ventricosus TaxID=182803 RepID=A0A4Y2M433_ARAVE|nr:hypothetical protein AVEN_184211-1 [Araneus ventricosus]